MLQISASTQVSTVSFDILMSMKLFISIYTIILSRDVIHVLQRM